MRKDHSVYIYGKKGKVNPSVSLSLLSQSTLPVYDIAFVRKISCGIALFLKLGWECQCELRWNIWHESQMTISASNKQVPQVSSWLINENPSLYQRARFQWIFHPQCPLFWTHSNVVSYYNFWQKKIPNTVTMNKLINYSITVLRIIWWVTAVFTTIQHEYCEYTITVILPIFTAYITPLAE